jgi:hypothetical protein
MNHELKKYAAHQLLDHGFAVAPSRGKRPLYQEARGRTELDWMLDHYHDLNIAILLTGQNLAVVDIDGPDAPWVDAHRDLLTSPMTALTSRGTHAYFRIPEDVPGCKLPDGAGDLKTRGVVTAPPSEHPDTGWIYRWVSGITRKELLPLLPGDLLVRPQRPLVVFDVTPGTNVRGIRHPEAWCLKVMSVQGQNGSGQLVRVVTTLRDCGRSAAETLRFLMEVWNQACATPPWSDAELEYAVRRHFKGE